ncbi:carboxyltransferase domain-containing protein [Promicromonospora thailandica]|uniref:Sensor histidine kinase inhibitor, KipI family n=1 Tax=Promicromonospora thailandica TaxID=765201 RepID=A0A9X2GC73_9MICO|nr:urea amidolyase family protein [Promicromonospora thailandica]MCP2266471.1 sensor histidine kinase inhibitor, KipI family [Promicromonospora thailandica]BFF20159.1 5-oxoprolinase/urea amidolyase family protein [Promicromonospora thailandica]
MRVLTARDDALLVELDDLDQAVALYESLLADPVRGVGVPVPGARTLLVPYRPSAIRAPELAAELRSRPLVRRPAAEARTVEIPVRYDGEDLAEAAALLGWSPEELVRRHTAAAWTVGFVGFAPGFAYLTGDDPELVVPRRSSPRTRVPAGSVALAGPYSGVYPRESPGGWQLVGRTDAPVWDVTRERPALMLPGDRVRFVAVTSAAESRSAVENDLRDGSGAEDDPQVVLEENRNAAGVQVVASGVVAVVQDLGRAGSEGAGVSASGALDRPSLRAANRAVGNPVDAAVVEAVGGLRLRARGPQVLAVTGAVGEIVVRPGAPRPRPGEPFALDDGDELRFAAPARGVRAYVAVRGGISVPPVLGSRATDVLAGLGPDPLRPGDLLPVGVPERGLPAVGPRAVPAPAVPAPPGTGLPAPGETTVLDIVLGPRDDWFDAAGIDLLTGQDWLVTPRSNRIGLRLDGTPLPRTPDRVGAELPSEGCVTGAIQVPPDGLPVLFLADHPLTGGYPVIGAVVAGHVPLAGQLPAGARIRFHVRDVPRPDGTTPAGGTP